MRHHKVVPFVAALLLAIATIRGPVAAESIPSDPPATNWAKLEMQIEADLELWKIPGLAVGVLHKGKVVYTGGFGVRNFKTGLPVTPKTLFPLGSCAEPLTSLTLGMLADEGRIDIDAPLAQTHPEFRFSDDAVTRLVSARDLMSQRTGVAEPDGTLEIESLTRAKVVESLRSIPADKIFRSEFEGRVLKGIAAEDLVEKVTKKSWEEIIRSRILDPLAMSTTTFGIESIRAADDAARPHRIEHTGNGEILVPFKFENQAGPQGWVNSNVEDLLRWMALYLDEQGLGLVDKETLRQGYQPHVFVYWPTSELLSPTNYGLFWGMNTYRGRYHVRLGGFGEGYECLLSYFPFDDLAIVLLANRGDEVLSYMSIVKYTIADRLLGLPDFDWFEWAEPRRQRAVARRTSN